MFWTGHPQLVLHRTAEEVATRVRSCFICAGLYVVTTVLCAWQILLHKVGSVGLSLVLFALLLTTEGDDVTEAYFTARTAD